MCLGGSRSSGPAVKSPTAPDVKKAPADESTSQSKSPQEELFPNLDWKGETTKAKTYDDVDRAMGGKTPAKTYAQRDVNINY